MLQPLQTKTTIAVVVLQGFCSGMPLTKMTHDCHRVPSGGSQIEWSQDCPFVPFGAKAHCLSPLPRTNSDSALHQSTMTPTQPEPFTGGSQDAHQKKGINRAHGCLSWGQAGPVGDRCAPRGHKYVGGQT